MTDQVTRTATVFTRHSAACTDAARGSQWRKCDCRKSVLTYDGTTGKQKMVSAKTRSWEKADAFAREWLDKFDPIKMELRALKAEKESQSVTIEHAVSSYLQDMIFRLGDNGTVSRTRALLGSVDAQGTVGRNGKLFDWLDKQIPRPVLISDITAAHINSWRNGWDYKSDLTAAISFDSVKTFFKYCTSQGWLKASPAASIRRPKIARGNRTATFSDAQYDAILSAARGDQRLETFLELLRWSGMSLVDAVEYDAKSLDADGTLRYTRIKSGILATVQLPEHVVVLLRSAEPFRHPNITLESSIQEWRSDLQALFAKAGITKVKTDVGMRPAHPHMLRDTFAVWYLRHGMSIYGVSKVLGHSNPTITAKHYLPFVAELEKAHIDENKLILAADKRKSPPAR